jgi:hypothetical protein
METILKHSLLLLFFCLFNALFANELPPYDQLSPYWKEYFCGVDQNIQENFWGNLAIYKKTKLFKDPYIQQMECMGYNFDDGKEHPAPFYNSLKWVFQELQHLIEQGELTSNDILWPAKAFECVDEEGNSFCIFVPIGGKIPENAISLNLLAPEVFVKMLSSGFFPIGNADREHTNQTLAEHDLAHMAGFISSPCFTKTIREAFRRVGEKLQANPKVLKALQSFDSAYSLRLYYTIEVFTEIPKQNLTQLQDLIEFPLNAELKKVFIDSFLLEKAKDPVQLYEYLSKLYWGFHSLVNPLGGESRDVLNRRRKFHRDGALGGFYDNVSMLSSKFSQNSLYSIFLNAKATLENKRSNHPDFIKSITEIHSLIIGALIGTSQLEIEDWVFDCIEENPNPNSKLYQYIHDSGFWNENNLLYRAFSEPEFDKILE